jgi:hypothetical protein
MRLIKTTIAAALFGLAVNAFAAVSDLSYTTHGTQSGQELKVGQVSEPRWSDRNSRNIGTDHDLSLNIVVCPE